MLRSRLLRSTPWSLQALQASTERVSSARPRLGAPLSSCNASCKASQRPIAARRRTDAISTTDTVYALSTAPGRAAIAVIRISGPACLDIYGGLCPNRPFPTPRTVALRKLYEPRSADSSERRVLDNGALVLYFPAPNTVTGEDVLELHVHGGPAVVKSILEAIPRCSDSRPRRRNAEYSLIRHAEVGEFTKRAFHNGKIDLTQAEALGEALAAETEQQRKLAIMGADSGLARRYEEWRQLLLNTRGELEALIDFSEDQHFDESPADFVSSVSGQVSKLSQQIRLHVENASRGELLRNGISLALIGAPNAGKSSLLNRIVGREAAIVSPEAGTTRDIVDVSIDIGGWLCRLGDMAGIRSSSSLPNSEQNLSMIGFVEQEGIRRARTRAMQSDVVIILLSIEMSKDRVPSLSIDPEIQGVVRECEVAGKKIVVAINKVDLLDHSQPASLLRSQLRQQVLANISGISNDEIHIISCRDADSPIPGVMDSGNLQSFLEGLQRAFTTLTAAYVGDAPESLVAGQAQAYWTASLAITHRQSSYLSECLAHLEDFLAQVRPSLQSNSMPSRHVEQHEDLVGKIESEVDIVAAAEHLRYAATCLAKITGKGEGGEVEDVLGVVFEK